MKKFAEFSSKEANIYSREARGAESNASGGAAMPGNSGQCSWAAGKHQTLALHFYHCAVHHALISHCITIQCVALYYNTLCCTVFQYIVLQCLAKEGKHRFLARHWNNCTYNTCLVLIEQISADLNLCLYLYFFSLTCICIFTCILTSMYCNKGACMVLAAWLSNPVHLNQSQEKENPRWIILKL